MKKIATFVILLLGVSIASYAQKIKVLEGDLNFLKGQTSVKAEFSYDKMIVGKEKTEEEYVTEKKEAYNKKEPGKGDKWAVSWVSDRNERFEPQFRELFSKHSKMSAVDEKAQYTLIFKTTRTEPGWNIGITKAPAYIDAEVWFVETQNHDKVLAKMSISKSPGSTAMGYDFDTGTRLQESYAKAGKELGQYILGKIK